PLWNGVAVGLAVFLVAGYFMIQWGMANVKNLRELRRVPEKDVIAALPGPVHLIGMAKKREEMLTSPLQSEKCFYYKYIEEEKETDSDGNVSWEPIETKERFVPFYLTDDSGTIPVYPSANTDFEFWEPTTKYQGDRRLKEYCIKSKDLLLVRGNVKRDDDNQLSVHFDGLDKLSPLISLKLGGNVSSRYAFLSVVESWLALLFFSMAMVMTFEIFRLHRSMVYLVALSILLVFIITYFGTTLLIQDHKASLERYRTLERKTKNAIQKRLQDHGVNWNKNWDSLHSFSSGAYSALSSRERKRLSHLKVNLQITINRLQEQYGTFPGNLASWFTNKPVPVDLSLTGKERKILSESRGNFERVQFSIAEASVPGVIGLVLGGFFSIFCVGGLKNKRIMENLSTVKIPGVTYGLNEIKATPRPKSEAGTSKGDVPSECTLVEIPDLDNLNVSDVMNFREQIEMHEVYLEKGNNRIKVNPEGAEFDIDGSDIESRESLRVSTDDQLYVLGPAKIDPSSRDKLQVGPGSKEDDEPYIISNKQESNLKLVHGRLGFWSLNIVLNAAILVVMSLFGFLGMFGPEMYFSSSVAVLGIASLISATFNYNDIVYMYQRVNKAWSNIEVSLKKRADLLPNLVEVVKNYLDHEDELLKKLSKIREQSAGDSSFTTETADQVLQLEQSALEDLSSVAEEYPELKSDENVSKLIGQLVALENEVALMREGYNRDVERYNVRIGKFPDAFLAKLFGFEREDFLSTELDSQQQSVDQLL
ncbi:MAG: LemA family protein, partial [bacterium]